MFLLPKNLKNRKTYIERITPFIGKNLIKIMTGQRRVGKSYILFLLIEYIQNYDKVSNIIYINKESLEYDSIQNAADLNNYIISKLRKDSMNYIFIDEIQEISNFEKALRSLILNDNIDIYCTGSNAVLLSGELASLLSGRYIEFSINSLSYQEFLDFHNIMDSEQSLNKYLKYGGLPYLVNLQMDDTIVFEYLKNIYTTIVYRDVIARYNLRSSRLLEQLVRFLGDNIGSIFSAKKISDFLKSQNIKISPNQILSYIEYLSNSFLIHKVDRYDLIGKRIFETGEKYYFENIGIRNAIIGFKPNDLGKLLENIVYNQLIFKGHNVRVGQFQNYEIDFVCDKNNEIEYYQVALNLKEDRTINREFGNLLKINDNFPKYVITLDNFEGNTYQGIQHLNLRSFLLQ